MLNSAYSVRLREERRRGHALRCVRSEDVEQPSLAVRGLRRLRRPGQCLVRERNLCAVRAHRFSLSRQSCPPSSAPRTGQRELAANAAWWRLPSLRPDGRRQKKGPCLDCSLAYDALWLDLATPGF